MTKKEYLLKLLSQLGEDVFPISSDIFKIIENNQMDEENINTLYDIFQKTVNISKDKAQKDKIQKGLFFLDKLKEAESKQDIIDRKDIQELDKLLDQI